MNKENLRYARIGCMLLLSLLIFILSFFLCGIPKKFSVPLGLICFLFEMSAVNNKNNADSSRIFHPTLSPLAFVVLYLWILYLLNHVKTLPVSFRHTLIFVILAIIAVDFIYYKLILCSTSTDTIDSISTSGALATSSESEMILPENSNNFQRNSLILECYAPVSKQSLDARVNYYNEKFDYMTGKDFEQYCAQLLHEVGFSDITVTPASGDFGVDILGKYNNVLYAFQCKRYSSNVGVDAVYQISGGMKYYHANVGIVLTNQYYTEQAQQLASEIGVVLWDRDFLYDLIDVSISGKDLVSLMFKTKI